MVQLPTAIQAIVLVISAYPAGLRQGLPSLTTWEGVMAISGRPLRQGVIVKKGKSLGGCLLVVPNHVLALGIVYINGGSEVKPTSRATAIPP